MNTLNLAHTQAQSKIILGVALIVAASAISLAFQSAGHAKNTALTFADASVQQVVVEAKRMSAEEKLAYDSAQQEYASVVIVGKRLSADEKLAMNVEGDASVKQAAHRKA
jgi:ABC-type transporter MlaC component